MNNYIISNRLFIWWVWKSQSWNNSSSRETGSRWSWRWLSRRSTRDEWRNSKQSSKSALILNAHTNRCKPTRKWTDRWINFYSAWVSNCKGAFKNRKVSMPPAWLTASASFNISFALKLPKWNSSDLLIIHPHYPSNQINCITALRDGYLRLIKLIELQ